MKVLTVKSDQVLDEELKNRINHLFGMEQHSDHLFRPRGKSGYSATILMDETTKVIDQIIEASKEFPDHQFVIDDLDMEANTCERYHVREGEVKENLRSGWSWD